MTQLRTETRPERVKAAAASMVGTTIENYDFLAYGTAAAAYFNKAFFPGTSDVVGTMLSFATLAVGFLTRPLGGIIAGHIGDRAGRKKVLIGALLVMGIATVLIGFLPTYDDIGIWAPILLVLIRLIQGIGHGAEWGGAVLMSVEHAPERRRGLYGSVPQVGVPLGLLLANGAFLVAGHQSGSWAWRLPFLLSAILVILGIIVRLTIRETPAFEEVKQSGKMERLPVLAVLRSDWRSVIRIMGMRMAETGGFYITTNFVLSYIALQTTGSKNVALIGVIIGSAIGLISHPIFGSLSDRLGRKPVMLAGAVVTLILGVPMFLAINTGNDILTVATIAIALVFSHDVIFAVEASWFSELFATQVRTSGISLGYQGASVIAGFIPLVATALFAALGWIGSGLLFCLLGAITLVCATLTSETAPIRQPGADINGEVVRPAARRA